MVVLRRASAVGRSGGCQLHGPGRRGNAHAGAGYLGRLGSPALRRPALEGTPAAFVLGLRPDRFPRHALPATGEPQPTAGYGVRSDLPERGRAATGRLRATRRNPVTWPGWLSASDPTHRKRAAAVISSARTRAPGRAVGV